MIVPLLKAARRPIESFFCLFIYYLSFIANKYVAVNDFCMSLKQILSLAKGNHRTFAPDSYIKC